MLKNRSTTYNSKNDLMFLKHPLTFVSNDFLTRLAKCGFFSGNKFVRQLFGAKKSPNGQMGKESSCNKSWGVFCKLQEICGIMV
jgi:hypothetical protein